MSLTDVSSSSPENDKPMKGLRQEDLVNQDLITELRKEFGMTYDEFYMVLTDTDMRVKVRTPTLTLDLLLEACPISSSSSFEGAPGRRPPTSSKTLFQFTRHDICSPAVCARLNAPGLFLDGSIKEASVRSSADRGRDRGVCEWHAATERGVKELGLQGEGVRAAGLFSI